MKAAIAVGFIGILLMRSSVLASAALDIQSEPAAMEPASRFDRTVFRLQKLEQPIQAAFAEQALIQLADAYRHEAELAVAALDVDQSDASIESWAQAVVRYSRGIDLLLEDIALGFPVQIRGIARQGAVVSVAGRNMILSHPRASEQAVFEQRILQAFCARQRCDEIAGIGEEKAPIPMSAGIVRPAWTFTTTGPVCSFRNISIAFPQAASLPRARALCAEVLEEAVILATDLAWQIRQGVQVQWDNLALHATPGRPQHQLELNDFGDRLLVAAPVTYSTEGLLPKLTPWIQAYALGRDLPLLPLDAEALGWSS